MNNEPWYSVKCVFRHTNLETENENSSVYEERIVLLKANNEDEAITLAEKDALEYANDVDCEFLNYASCFHTFEDKIIHLSELYSIMRESELDPEKYLDLYYDTGSERVHE